MLTLSTNPMIRRWSVPWPAEQRNMRLKPHAPLQNVTLFHKYDTRSERAVDADHLTAVATHKEMRPTLAIPHRHETRRGGFN